MVLKHKRLLVDKVIIPVVNKLRNMATPNEYTKKGKHSSGDRHCGLVVQFRSHYFVFSPWKVDWSIKVEVIVDILEICN